MEYFTVFTCYLKSRWTWDYKKNKRIGFRKEEDAIYAAYCGNRRKRRISKKRKYIFTGLYIKPNPRKHRNVFVCSESYNNETIATENYE